MRNKNILLTGASGFIGKWLQDRLLVLEANVSIIIRKQGKTVNLPKNKKLRVYHADIIDYHAISDIIKNQKFDFVFHLASKNINYGHQFDLIETFDTIIKGTYNILDACRLYARKDIRIILTSSREVFNDNENKNSLVSNRFHPYEVSKKSVDLIVKSFSQNFSLNILSFRPPNIYGGGDLNWNRIIPGTIKSIINKKRPVIRTDGSLLRSYLYVEDFIDAIILLAKKGLAKNSKNPIYDIEDLELHSTKEIVNRIINISGEKLIEPKIENVSKDEKFNIIPSVENSIRDLGWKPVHSIDSGLTQTLEWYRNYFLDN